MAIFEKIKLEPIEVDEPINVSRSKRRWVNDTLVVVYPWLKRAGSLIYPLIFLPILVGFWEEGFFAFEVLIVCGIVATVWFLADCLLTCDITFAPGRITKRGYLGQTVLPADSLVMRINEQQIRFYHGTEKNFREAIRIYRYCIGSEAVENILGYAEDVYHLDSKDREAGGKTSLALINFHEAASSYKVMAAFFVIFSCIAVFTVGIQDSFIGLAPAIPAFAARLVCIGLAAMGFFLLKRVVTKPDDDTRSMSLELRMKRESNGAFTCAAVACAIAFLGLVLFLLCGNMLDFYFFLLAGILCFVDFYPRYSRWEQAVSGRTGEPGPAGCVALPQRRSFQISLVLMGTLAITSYGESYHYIYKSRQDCLDDWSDDSTACRETASGGGRYYGPRYGSRTGRPVRAVGVSSVSRGGFGSLSGFHASFGG